MVIRQSHYKEESFLIQKKNWSIESRTMLLGKLKEARDQRHLKIILLGVQEYGRDSCFYSYTLGEPIEDVSVLAIDHIDDVVNYIVQTNNQIGLDKTFQQYLDCLHLLAFCYYFDAPKEHVQIIADNNPFTGNDCLIDYLIKACLPEHLITPKKLAFPDIYQPLLDAIGLLHEPDAYKDKMTQFLEGYYPGLGRHHVTWHDSHKEKNPDYCVYTGYWIFELPALLLSTNILDDRVFRDHPFYPKDLAEWKKDQIRESWA